MKQAWLVAKHEYLHNIRRPGFLFAAFGVPLLVGVITFIVAAVAIDSETNVEALGAVGYVDEAGVLSAALEQPERFTAFASEADARAALDAREVGAYFVVRPDYLATGRVSLVSPSDIPAALEDQIERYLLANLTDGVDAEQVERILSPVNLTIRTLNDGRTQPDTPFAVFIAPFVFVMVFILGAQTTSGYLMSGVVEEKSNRIMEILVTTVTPFQLLMGKILGLGALGLTQLAIWGAALFVAVLLGQSSFLAGVTVPLDLLAVGTIYFLLGYFMLASLMAGLGAVIGSEQESRQFAGIFSLILFIPFFFIVNFFTDPEGALVTFLTLFPLTSPVAAIMRYGFGTLPTWQLVISIALLLVTTLFIVWASARVFRWSLLLYGKRPGLRDLLGAFRSSRMATSATEERTG